MHRVFLAFDVTRPFFNVKKIALVGTPIRVAMLKRLMATAPAPPSPPPTRPVLHVFICGGSLGAVKLDEIASEAMIYVSENRTIHVVHQTGKQGLGETEARYRNAGLGPDRVDCREFIDDMAAQYAAADIIIARAGAATVAELAITGKPAIFVPYPFAADNHQELNAKEIVDGGGAKMFRQADLSGDIFVAQFSKSSTIRRCNNAWPRASAGFKPDAGRVIAQWCAASH